MMSEKSFAVPNPMTPNIPVTFNEEKCIGCNRCVDICRCDVMIPNPEAGKPPIILYPDECWFCGCCVADCPVEDASVFHHPVGQKLAWKRKETGQLFRSDTKEQLPPVDIHPFY